MNAYPLRASSLPTPPITPTPPKPRVLPISTPSTRRRQKGQAQGQAQGQAPKRVIPPGYGILDFIDPADGKRRFAPMWVGDHPTRPRVFPARNPTRTHCAFARFAQRSEALAFIRDWAAAQHALIACAAGGDDGDDVDPDAL